MNKLKFSINTGRLYVERKMKTKVKYTQINLERTINHNGHEYLYFVIDGGAASEWEGTYFEWQRGSQTINTKAEASYESQDLHCFSMSYNKERPTVRDAKSCILDYLNEG
jgi:hypothetical protein